MTSHARDGTFQTSDQATIAFTVYPAPRPDAPRLALVHSLALDRSIWDGVVTIIARETELLTYDCRGHGRSDRRATTFTTELFARDLGQLLHHVGWPSAAVGGCSMGGCVAMAFAGVCPERVTGLALIDTTAWYGPEAPTQFRARAEAARTGGMTGLIDFQVARWFSDAFVRSHPDVVTRITRTFVANDFDCYARSCALLGDADLRPYLPAFRMPLSIVVGEEDPATPPAMARELHAAIPQSTLVVIPGAKHLTPIECPDRISSALLGIVRRSSLDE
jgi:3-oxoadipate enol-lactonase